MKLRVALIETAAPNVPGSMQRFATMLESAIGGVQGSTADRQIQLTHINLTGGAAIQKRLPTRLRNWAHHAAIVCNTRRLHKSDYDVFHILDGSHGYVTRWLPGERTIVTAHDVIPWLQSHGEFPTPPPGRGARWMIGQSLRGLSRAAKVLAVSASTASDLRRAGLIRADIDVCPMAITEDWAATDLAHADAEGESIVPITPYLFHVGNNGFYKNRGGVLRIFAAIEDSHHMQLVMAGPAADENLLSTARELKIHDRIHWVVNPTDVQLRMLYSRAICLLFPSIYEGFGWPPLEAMACGCPVVASNRGSLPEVTGDAGLLGDPDDTRAMAVLCRSVLTDAGLRARLQQAGKQRVQQFTMDRLGRQVIQAYRDVHDSASH